MNRDRTAAEAHSVLSAAVRAFVAAYARTRNEFPITWRGRFSVFLRVSRGDGDVVDWPALTAWVRDNRPDLIEMVPRVRHGALRELLAAGTPLPGVAHVPAGELLAVDIRPTGNGRVLGTICQVADPALPLPCTAEESGGYRCEVYGPHTAHRIGEHTIAHSLAGNGYTCAAIDARKDPA